MGWDDVTNTLLSLTFRKVRLTSALPATSGAVGKGFYGSSEEVLRLIGSSVIIGKRIAMFVYILAFKVHDQDLGSSSLSMGYSAED